MDRRYWSLILIAVIGSTVNAQNATVRNGEFSVVGDVARPQTLRFDQALPVGLQTLLQHSDATTAGVATIIRYQGQWQVVAERQLSPAVRASPVEAPLASGDIVIYRSSTGRIPDHANALVVFADGRAELPLPDGTCTVHQLLKQLHLPPRSVQVIRSDRSSAVVMPLKHLDQLRHCDVIDLSDVSSHTLNQPVAFQQPPRSDSPNDFQNHPVMQPATMSAAATEHSAADATGDSGPMAASPLMLPSLDRNLPRKPESSATAAPSPTDDAFRVASLSAVLSDSADESDARNSTAAAASAVAPAVIDSSAAATEAGGSFVMDTIFIAGLLFAMGLILVGWARMKREQELEHEINSGLRHSLANAGPPREPSSSTTPEVQRFINEPAASEATSAAKAVETSDDPLISGGADWFAAADETAISAAADPGPVSTVKNAAKTDAATVAKSTAPPAGNIDSDVEILDELIENRLPAKLVDTDLPLQVSLFGRPQGPQRLRVDAAHQQIAAPHMVKRSRAKGTSQVQKVAAARPPQADPTATGDVDFSRLDRALNSLREQADS